jgi:hypothetical protein
MTNHVPIHGDMVQQNMRLVHSRFRTFAIKVVDTERPNIEMPAKTNMRAKYDQ